jgi:hypothetical protein
VQTAGVTVRVLPFGGTEADGAGTVAYSTDGIVVYTPTQGETNYTSFILIAKKTGCIPASVTVVTSASSTAGHAGTDQSKITNATSTVNLSGTTISTSQAVQSVTNRVTANVDQWNGSTATGMPMPTYTQPTGFLAATFPGTVSSPTNITSATGIVLAGVTHTGAVIPTVTDVTTKTGYTAAVSDKTGFKLASDGLALVTAWTVGITGNITGNLSGSVGSVVGAVGSISGVTFPANFGSMAINGTTGHTAAVVHSVQAGAYTSAAFSANWLTAAGLASDAANEIATAVSGIQVLSRLDSMIEDDGTGQFRFDTIAVSMVAGGGGGTDWTANERTAIRTILGVPTSGTTPTDPTSGILDEIRDKTALITAGGTVYVTSPVTATGQLTSPLIIGDDYLAANGRRFRWTVALPSGYVIATSTARFGMRYEDDEGVNEFVSTGTVTDATGGNVYLDFDVSKTVTGTLRPGWYEWSVEIVSATGVEITRVKSGKNAEWQEKQT